MPDFTRTRCSKPKGEFCRLHNPAPKAHSFKSVHDVFAQVDVEMGTTQGATKVSFQRISETRTLPDGISQNLAEHVAQSRQDLQHLTEEEKNALSGYTGFGAGVCNSILLGRTYEYYDEAPRWRESSGPCDFIDRADLVDYMETIDGLLAERQPKARIVYRGTPIYKTLHDEIGDSIGKQLKIGDTEGLVEGLKEYYKEGKVFNYNTYLSTTHSAHYAAERTTNSVGTKQTYYDETPEITGIMFEMKTNAGLDITGVARIHHQFEREVVIPRDTHFKVTNVYVKPASYDTVSGYDHKPEQLEKETYKNIAVVVQLVEVDSKGNEITHTRPHKPRPAIEDIVPK